ncbi:hypothetical protein HYV86_05480 [Candidatus Woesearchaeota archaeon]|nr:hypothetical protein [Candidatus Woesearchaeota archaeon]
MTRHRKGEISITFNWIYVAIAGAVILLFFAGLIVKSKATAEQQLSFDVITILDSIFTGAQASENTKTPIDTSGLTEYTLQFECDERVTTYSIKDTIAKEDAAIAPIFSPYELQTPRLILWSLPYKFPFKVIDFLFVTSPNTKYFVIGSTPSSIEFINEFDKATKDSDPRNQINKQILSDPAAYALADPQNNYQVRFIDLDGKTIPTTPPPLKIKSLADNRVSAVSFGANNVKFYQKKGETWVLSRGSRPEGMSIISVASQRDATKYAAIFSGSEELYRCNMQKAFERLEYVSQIYSKQDTGKLAEMIQYYQAADPTLPCLEFLKALQAPLDFMANTASQCKQEPTCDFGGLITNAAKIQEQNTILSRNGCLTLY